VISGLKFSDNITASYATTATATSLVGPYPITVVTPLTDPNSRLGNYDVTLKQGTLTIQYAATGTCNADAGHVILQPVNTDGKSVFKQGSTVPAKFRVCDANGVSIGTAGVVTGFTATSQAGTATATVNETIVSTTPDTAFRWDPTAQQWIFNISTKNLKANTTYMYDVALNDGTHIQFQFGLK
jgi:hypothetical protein